MSAVAFATCASQPDLQPDDARIAAALRSRGVEVRALPWNGAFEPFRTCRLVWVRSTWDYHRSPEAFEAWLRRLDDENIRTINAPRLMRWNLRKSYLLDLVRRGAPVPPTREVAADAGAIADAMRSMDLEAAVVKPVYGAGGDGLSVVREGDRTGLARAVDRLAGVDALVQPLIPEIRTAGEMSLMFLGQAFSHAVIKRPADGSVLIHEEHGGCTEPVTPDPEQLSRASEVLALLPHAPHYARIDLVPTGSGPLLMEVEVIEPELFVRFDRGAAERWAAACCELF